MNNLKEDIQDRLLFVREKINTELEKIDNDYAADMEELTKLSKLKAKSEITGEQFEYQDKLDMILGRISTYDVRRQAVEDLKAEMKIRDEDRQQLRQLELKE